MEADEDAEVPHNPRFILCLLNGIRPSYGSPGLASPSPPPPLLTTFCCFPSLPNGSNPVARRRKSWKSASTSQYPQYAFVSFLDTAPPFSANDPSTSPASLRPRPPQPLPAAASTQEPICCEAERSGGVHHFTLCSRSQTLIYEIGLPLATSDSMPEVLRRLE